MTIFGQRLIQSAREAVAIAKGEADPSTYRVLVPAAAGIEAKIKMRQLPAGSPLPVISPAQEVAASEREVRRAMLERFRL